MHKSGQILSILNRLEQPIGALAKREEQDFEGATAIVYGTDSAVVTFHKGRRRGTSKAVTGQTGVRNLLDIAERVDILITTVG